MVSKREVDEARLSLDELFVHFTDDLEARKHWETVRDLLDRVTPDDRAPDLQGRMDRIRGKFQKRGRHAKEEGSGY
jgi:hypothetical protein